MSWIEKLNAEFSITTGDGKVYSAAWLNASKHVEYNFSRFEFKDLPGTLAIRKQPRGTRYIIEIYFQGDNNIDMATEFQVSASNPEPWSIAHPFYGSILVQPSSITFDNFDYNVTKITGDFIETITISGATRLTVSAPDKIAADKEECDTLLNETCATQVPNVNASDTRSLLERMSQSYKALSSKIDNSDDAAILFNAYNSVNAQINSNVVATIQLLNGIRDYTTLPYQFQDTLVDRLNMFVLQFDTISNGVANLFNRTSRKLYENNAGLSIAAMALCSVTNIGDSYATMAGTLAIVDTLLRKYNKYIDNLDYLQGENGGDPDSYIPDADAVTAVSQLVGYTVSVLLDIARSGKQQRITHLAEDSNLIDVAHKIYGLDSGDHVIDELMNNNGIGLNEILGLKKGRQIIYYV